MLALLEEPEDHSNLSRAAGLAGLISLFARNLDECLDMVARDRPDLIITRPTSFSLDRPLFIETVTRIKQTETLPIVFLDDGANMGGATSLKVLDAVQCMFLQIRASLRRERPSVLGHIKQERSFILNEAEFRLSFGQRYHDLSKSELCLIGPFFDSPDTVFDRVSLEYLAFNTFHYTSGNRQIDFYVSRMRRSVKRTLGMDPLRSVRGQGYSLIRP